MEDQPVQISASARLAAACAAGASTAEFLGIAALIGQHETGEDLSDTLRLLLKLQELKEEQRISRIEMTTALGHSRVAQLRSAIAAVVRARRFATGSAGAQ